MNECIAQLEKRARRDAILKNDAVTFIAVNIAREYTRRDVVHKWDEKVERQS
jgi:hypothetical protein